MKRRARAGLWIAGAIALVGACADLIASDLPLLARLEGELWILPCLTHPAALSGDDNQSLEARAGSRDFVLAPPIPYGPEAQHPGGATVVLAAPSGRHWLGTDDRGRDVAARLVHGARTALLVGPLAVLLALFVGAALGAACALGRSADLILGRLIEVGLSFPLLLFLLALQGLVGGSSLVEVALVLALAWWPHFARMARAESLRAAASPHVEAARALGASPVRLALRHVLPLAAGPLLTAAAFAVGQAILVESALTFLGFGVPAPRATWGELLSQAQVAGLRANLLLPPALMIALTVLAGQLLGESKEEGS